MRDKSLMFVFSLLLATSCFAQSASVNVQAHGGPIDNRPFGKYLLEICTLTGEERTLSCIPTRLAQGGERNINDARRFAKLVDQTIALKLVCDPALKEGCSQSLYPLQT